MIEPPHRVTTYPESAFEMRMSAQFGHACRLLWAISGKKPVLLGDVSRRLTAPIRLNQIEFLFNSHGAPIAFATWGFLTESCGERLTADPAYVLHLSEWNEGDQLWIIDIVAVAGQVQNLVRKLRNRRLSDVTRAYGARVRGGLGRVRPTSVKLRRREPDHAVSVGEMEADETA
ncbi:MAG: toxin-activating lysine-acyltransferase [Sphingomonas bacterium]